MTVKFSIKTIDEKTKLLIDKILCKELSNVTISYLKDNTAIILADDNKNKIKSVLTKYNIEPITTPNRNDIKLHVNVNTNKEKAHTILNKKDLQ